MMKPLTITVRPGQYLRVITGNSINPKTLDVVYRNSLFHVASKGGCYMPPTDHPDTPARKALDDGHEVRFDEHEMPIDAARYAAVPMPAPDDDSTPQRDASEMMHGLLDYMRREPAACVLMLYRLATANNVRQSAKALHVGRSVVHDKLTAAARKWPQLRRILRIRPRGK